MNSACDEIMTFADIRKAVDRFVVQRNWQTRHQPKDLAISISVEAAELLQIVQWRDDIDENIFKQDTNIRERVIDELADVMIYCSSRSRQHSRLRFAQSLMSCYNIKDGTHVQ
jgi:dCTP diphosphatase